MTSREVKQDFLNRTSAIAGRMAGLLTEIDDVFLVGLAELEHQIKVTRGNLAMRRVIDTNDDLEDDL